jgi:hypothetical protein
MLIKVKVFAGCKKDETVKRKNDEYNVRVREKQNFRVEGYK